jgi:ABC-type multidrug transport system fused ATPase/permease subunit
MLWHGTVRDNLDITQDCTDDEIWAALKSVEMIETVSKLVSSRLKGRALPPPGVGA